MSDQPKKLGQVLEKSDVSIFQAAYHRAFIEVITREVAPISDEHRARNSEIQRKINILLPAGYRFWLLRDLTALIYRRENGERRCVAQLRLSSNRGWWVAVNEINLYMAHIAQTFDCGRPERLRGQGPEFVLSTKLSKE